VVPGNGIALAKGWAKRHGGTCVVLDPERQIARWVIKGWTIDVARQEGASLEADLGRRDFTINAIALPLPQGGGQGDGQVDGAHLEGALVDPTGGLRHLEQRQLVAVQETNLVDDPLRLLRGLRLAAELNFELEGESRTWIARHAPLLATVAGERVLAELEKLAAAPQGHRGLQDCLELGLLEAWGADPKASQALGHLDPARATARCLQPEEQAWALPLARLACLLDSQGLVALRSSRRLQQRCRSLRRWQGSPVQGESAASATTEHQLLELHRSVEADLPALVLHLSVAEAQAALQRWRDPRDPLFHPRAPIDGQTLQQQLGLAPGRQLGALLHHLTLEHAFGRLPSGPAPDALAAVLAAANQWLAEQAAGNAKEAEKPAIPSP
jgi:tRNA nucleotidyltransferase (CCA-adding enzyme)